MSRNFIGGQEIWCVSFECATVVVTLFQAVSVMS